MSVFSSSCYIEETARGAVSFCAIEGTSLVGTDEPATNFLCFIRVVGGGELLNAFMRF